MNFSHSITLFRIRGIPIRAHWSLLLVLVYCSVAFTQNFEQVARFAQIPASSLTIPPLVWGVLVAVGLFVSIAIHELAHSLFALRTGGKVSSITLMLVGGVSEMKKMPPKLGLEGWMALVGPLTSVLLAGLFWMLRVSVPLADADLRLGLFYLASLNFTLGIFNLLPAFPMDGGRVLRAMLGTRLGRARATAVAARVGKVMSVLFGIWGILSGNVLLIIVAFFLFGGAGAEAASEEIHVLLQGRTAKDLMSKPLTVASDQPIEEVGVAMQHSARLEAVVVDRRGEPVGVVTAADVSGHGDAVLVGDLSRSLRKIDEIPPDASAEIALRAAAEHGGTYLLVREETPAHSIVGFIGRRELQNALTLTGLRANSRPTNWSQRAPTVPGMQHR